jgi:hypothetical protein
VNTILKRGSIKTGNFLRSSASLNLATRILLLPEDQDVGGWITLGWILERWDEVMWTGLVWLRIGTGGELL